jgi:hypothetical protein
MTKEKVKTAVYLQFYGDFAIFMSELNCARITGVVLTKPANTRTEQGSFYMIYFICNMERVQVH